MKQLNLSIALLLLSLIVCTGSYATIYRVGYSGIPLEGTDFSNLQAAHDAAKAGDTIHLFPGIYSANITKRLIFIGKGFNTEGAGSNANLQSIPGAVSINADLYDGSDSTVFIGMSDGEIKPYYNNKVSYVKIRRCRLSYIYFNNVNCSNWEISQCYIYNGIRAMWGGGLATPINILNSFINQLDFTSFSPTNLSGAFLNNVFGANTAHSLLNGAFLFQSNIFTGQSTYFLNSSNCIFQNNLAESSTLLPEGSGNANSVSMENTFAGYPTQNAFSDDARFQLKAGSPAKAAGYEGVDAGMFGGTNPYKLSGIPPIPVIYKLTAPSTVANNSNYSITISVRSNN